MIKLYKTALLAAFTWLSVGLQAQNKLAFIYDTDSTEASSYKSFLKNVGFETHLVSIQEVVTHDFSDENLIIAGSNSAPGWTSWGTDLDVAKIKSTKKPVIAFCYGGSGLFKKLNLWNNGGQAASNGFGTSLKVLHPDHALYNVPNVITLNADSTFEPFVTNNCSAYLYAGGVVPSHVTLFDRSNVTGQKGYSGLAVDSSKYYYLGYPVANTNTDFTTAGKAFFVNLVYNAGQFSFVITGNESEVAIASSSTFFPNPSKGIFNLNSTRTINHIGIYNSTGSLAKDIEQPTQQLDLTDLKAGVYSAKMHFADKVEITKLIIE